MSHNQFSWDHARWQVMWQHPKRKGEIIVHEFDHDFVSALELYVKVKSAGRKLATLCCVNLGSEPPERYADTRKIYGRRKGKKVLLREEVIEPHQYLKKMMKLNREGAWWCPHCMTLRFFRKYGAYVSPVSGTEVSTDAYECPVCEIMSTAPQVRKYNPITDRIHPR